MTGSSSLNKISRDPLELVGSRGKDAPVSRWFHAVFGTMFAPTQDRHGPGRGFTHEVGDVVSISSAKFGKLVNRVGHSDQIALWTFGIAALMGNLCGAGIAESAAVARSAFQRDLYPMRAGQAFLQKVDFLMKVRFEPFQMVLSPNEKLTDRFSCHVMSVRRLSMN